MTSQRYIGLMSGTSMDGVDAVLIHMQGNQWSHAQAHAFLPYSETLKSRLLELQNIGQNELHRSHLLAQELSLLYAAVVKNLLIQQQLDATDICAIGCHGQTIRHAPEHHYSIQLANLPMLAEHSGIFTIGDFRSRDLAAGGQGAPLVPAFHQSLFGSSRETRVVLNIGGIANISVLPASGETFGFDTGPGNMLMDAWTQHIWQQPYDKGGELAAQGTVLPRLLADLLAHPYFKQPHPKSTGRELFSLAFLQQKLSGQNPNPYDVLRTLSAFTADSIAQAIKQAAPDAREIYICGGGIRNPVLLEALQHHLADSYACLKSTAELGLDPQWVEAAAFGWLAACWINRRPSNPALATGAAHPCILGGGYYA